MTFVGRVEVGLADLEVDDFFALLFEGASAVQHFKSGFGSKARHPSGKAEFELGGGGHSGGWHYSASEAGLAFHLIVTLVTGLGQSQGH